MFSKHLWFLIAVPLFLFTACAALETKGTQAVPSPDATVVIATAVPSIAPTLSAIPSLETSPTLDSRLGPQPTPDVGYTMFQNMTKFQWMEKDANGNVRS